MTRRTLFILALGFLPIACSPSGPPAIRYGGASCAQCRMEIVDQRFGAELVLHTGKALPFDAIDCMLAYSKSLGDVGATSWVADYMAPGQLIPATTAVYIEAPDVSSPMGRRLIATSSRELALAVQRRAGGRIVRWADL